MINEFETALGKVESAAQAIFAADVRVRAVGVCKAGDHYGFVAIRNVKAPTSFAARIGSIAPPDEFEGIPVVYSESRMDPVHLARVPLATPAALEVNGVLPEQQVHRPPACGLQLQNTAAVV